MSAGVAALGLPAQQAHAEADDGTLTVQVVKDVNGNGTYEEALETPVDGIPVTVTDNGGATADGTTGSDGTATVDTADLTGGKYRVDASIPESKSNLRPAPAGDGLSSLTDFVDVSGGQDQTVTMGVWDPSAYTGDDPDLALPIQKYAEADETRAVVTFPYDARGQDQGTTIATQDQVGTTYGEAYDRSGERVFAGAFAKRHTTYGPGGAGAIYVMPRDGSAAPSVFATVPNAGTTQHTDAFKDGDFFDTPGKEGLGDLEISPDGETLYAVNLNDRSLYEFDATGDTGTPQGSTEIPDPGCAAAGDWRPFGLGAKGSDVYVGGVCSAESSGDRGDLRAVVYSYDGSDFTEVLNDPLDFERGAAHTGPNTGEVGTHWNAWEPDFSMDMFDGPDGGQYIRPTPELSDIVFDGDSMVLGFRDRMTDQMGWEAPTPVAGDDTLMNIDSGGDLSKACGSGGTYTLDAVEPGGDCPNSAASVADGGQPDGVTEFFAGDWAIGSNPASHQEAAMGGVALAPGQDVASTELDPVNNVWTSGVGWYDRGTGEGPGNDPEGRGLQVVDDAGGQQSQNGFSKAGGLGDLEVLADNAPMQLGNRVWFDEDRDGEQDAAEACLPGASVRLLDENGEELATTETNDRCEYYFGGAEQPDLVEPETDYTVEFDACSADTSGVPGSPDAADLQLTEPEAVEETRHDSDAEPVPGGQDCAGSADVTTPQTQGHAYNTVDAGFYGPEVTCAIGDYVWSDDNANGIQDDGEAPVEGVEVELLGEDGNPVEDADGDPVTATTDEDGMYEFGGIDCGRYKVRFTPPEGRGFTEPEAGGDPEVDSDPDPQSGEAPVVEVTRDEPEDLSIDAGLTPKKCTIGDYVWKDDDGDGIQDDGEPGVSGVTVSLLDEDGNPVEDADGNPVTTTTGEDGTYLFDPVECGTYQVEFGDIPNGMSFTEPGAGEKPGRDSDPNPNTGVTPMFEVTEENPKDLTIDAGLVEAQCLGTVGDMVWDDRNGNGIQDSGEPGIAGVTVELLDEDGNVVETSTGEPATVVTDENGEYRFTSVPCGTYKVRFSNLPDGTTCTEQMAGDDPAVDSNPDPRSCVTPTFDVTEANPKVLTVDAGVVKAPGAPGDVSLPYTGAEIGLASLLGATLVGAGALLLVAVRRRRHGTRSAEGPDAG